MNTIKSLTARKLDEEFPQLREVQWSGRIWADVSPHPPHP
jgi:hypothetical protein